MWLHDLKQQNRNPQPRSQASDQEPPIRADHLTDEEHIRLKEKTQALHNELAASVKHIDPAEYTESRVHQLLEQAHQNAFHRKTVIQPRET